MVPFVRRGLHAVAALAASAAVVGGGLAAASPGATAAPGGDPTITIRVGGVRTAENGPPGPSATSGLAGVTFRVTPSSAGQSDSCVSTAAGLCTLKVASSRTYTITQVGTPSGWFASSSLAAGSPGQVTPHVYDMLSVKVGTGNVTVPAAAPNSDRSATARGGTWALSRSDPALPEGCGLRIALLIDLSSSITPAILPSYKAAARAFVEALKGTPSSVAIYTFGTTAPAPGANDTNLAPVSVASQAGVTTLVNKINRLTVPSGSATNWDAGLWQIVRDNPARHYQSAIILTDGDPTRYGPPGNLGGTGSLTRFAEVENGIFSANALKNEGTSVLSVGIGASSHGLRYTENIRAISGPVENKDYYNTDFERLSAVLAQLALRNCAGLDLTKTAAPATYTHAGERITYIYRVTNTKFFTLHDVHVADDRIRGSIPCTPSTLAAGKKATCTASYTVTQANVEAGHVTNVATATGTTPNDHHVTSQPAEETVRVRPVPDIRLVKSVFPARYSAPGEQITYTYAVTNTGNVTLHGITLTDNKLGAITCPVTALPPNESTTCTAEHTTTQADVDAGHITNSATVTGHPSTGPPVTDTDRAVVTAVHLPGIELDKTAFPTEFARPGERITYTYLVVNTGNVTLRDVAVHDDRLGRVTCPLSQLAPGASMTCEAVYMVSQADVDAGQVVNAAVVTGHPPTGRPVTGGDTAVVTAVHLPGIELDKTAFPTEFASAGERITYTYLVTNTGNVTLRDVAVRDDRLGSVACPLSQLAPGVSMTCHTTHTTTQADVDAGQVVNAAVVTGQPPTGPAVTGGDTAIVTAVQMPGIELDKTAYPTTYDAAGEKITYTYLVVNTGNVTLHGVTVADDRLGAITCPATQLAAGKSMTCEAAYAATQADVDAGQVVNAAVVTGQPPTGPAVTGGDTAIVTAVQMPGIELDKTAYPTTYDAAGEKITYTYLVVNTGNVTLHGVTVADDRLGSVACPLSELGPRASMTCEAVYPVTQADVDTGRVVNAAVVTGQPPTGPLVTDTDTAVAEAVYTPGIELKKSASPTTYDAAGEKITYTYLVVNTGNVTLHDITVTDNKIHGLIACQATALAPGKSTTCRAMYTTTWADVAACRITNVAIAAGSPPAGPQVTSKDEATVTLTLPEVPVTG